MPRKRVGERSGRLEAYALAVAGNLVLLACKCKQRWFNEMVYGFGTRSYFGSVEHRQNKRAQKEVTAKYLAGELNVGNCVVGPMCTCRSFNLPHEIERHKELRSDMDWRTESERQAVEYDW